MRTIFLCTFAMIVVGGAPAYAAQRGQGPVAQPTHATAPKPAPAPHATAAHGPSTTTHGQSAASHSSGQGHVSAHSTTKTSTAPKTKTNTKSTATTSTSTTGATGSASVTLTPVQQKLQRNTQLASKLQGRLPQGTDLMLAAAGFRNLGQFVAAVNVSNNLGIPFTQMKTQMVDNNLSLGQAIQKLRPGSDSQLAVQAEREADETIRTTTTTTTTTTSTTTKSKSKPKTTRTHGNGQ
jgi:hypothetical protein